MFAPRCRAQVAHLCTSTAAHCKRSIFATFFASPAAPALPHFNALPADAFADTQSQPRPFGFAVGADEQRRIDTCVEQYGTEAADFRKFYKNISGTLRTTEHVVTFDFAFEDFARMRLNLASTDALSPKNARQCLVEFLTRPFLTAIYNSYAELPLVGFTDVPTADELHRGAEALFHWLTATFAAACQQVRDSGGRVPPTISFRAPKYADRIAPELAALLDAQIAHYALCGVVPVAEYRAPDASLCIARLLPPQIMLNWLTRGHNFFSREMRLTHPLMRAVGDARSAALNRSQQGETTTGEPPSLAPLRVELFFQVAAEERMQWAGLKEGRLLTQLEVSELKIEHPSAHQLGLFCARTYSIAVVADATLPLRFKLRNLNEAVWAV
jgi:hypothetical protein